MSRLQFGVSYQHGVQRLHCLQQVALVGLGEFGQQLGQGGALLGQLLPALPQPPAESVEVDRGTSGWPSPPVSRPERASATARPPWAPVAGRASPPWA